MSNPLPSSSSSSTPTTYPSARFWDGMDIFFWNGFWFEHNLIPAAITFRSSFHPRPGDVLLASTMKTGTTWLKSLALSLIDPSTSLDSDNPHYLLPTIESAVYTTKPLLTSFYDASNPRLLHTHLPYSLLPDSLKHPNSPAKIIYVARNPKDTLVSSWHFFNTIIKPYPIESAVNDFCNGIFQYGPFFDHVAEYWLASKKWPERILFLKYEEMKRDTKREVAKIVEFLGMEVGEEEVEKIVEKCKLERMKELDVNKNGESLMNVPNRSYFRKGEVGDWKNWLSPEMVEKIDGVCRERFDSIGLFF